MNEIVVRMEMPKNCLKCPLRNQCEVFCDWFGGFGTSAMRKPYPKPLMKGCMIICQLPEGHGRLVDKDEVIESIRTEVTELFFNGLKGTPRPDGDLRFMWNRLEDEDFAPTIVPAEAERSET